MKKLFVIYLGAAALLLSGCKAQPILVESMEFEKSIVKLFPGEQQEMRLNCYPSNATNLDELSVTNTNPSVATFENGKLKAIQAGDTFLQALCGSVSTKAKVTVYSGWFTKGGIKYGVDSASGWYFTMGESTPQEMQMTLTHMVPNSEDTQNFWFWMKCENLGTTIDFMQDMKESQVSVQLNNNEDGYCVPYYSEDLGRPVVKLADWGDTDVTLTKGLLTVTRTGTNTFSVSADFALSNGYTFTAQWEGTASMKTE
jgi:hypothetical protein